MSFGGGSKKTTVVQQQNQKVEPWEPAIPQLKAFLGDLRRVSGGPHGPTPEQRAALDQLKANAGNPFASDISQLASDLFGSTSRAPMVEGAFADLSRRLTPIAEGSNLDIMSDPQFQALLQSVSDDVQSRINSQFAGAGRDLSGINQQAVARGVSQAQLPIIVDQLNREKARTDAAIRDLFGGAGSTATTGAALDTQALTQRGAGVDAAQAAIDARDQGAERIFDLEQMAKQMPFEELSWLASLLFPAAGLGQQSEGAGKSTSKSSGFNFGFSL